MSDDRAGVDGPVLDQINIVVRDMDASVAFYRLLGLDVPDTLPQWQHLHRNASSPGGLDLDLDHVDFARQWNTGAGGVTGTGQVVIGLRLPSRDSVDALYERVVAAGHRGQQRPYDAFWGARYAVVEDPDGNPVGLMSPVDAAMRSEAPVPREAP